MSYARERLLSRAPITEAVLELRVELERPLTSDDFTTLRTTFAADFESVVEQREIEALFQLEAGKEPYHEAVDRGVRRLMFRSDTRDEVLIAGETGFAYSKLKPYSSFEKMRSRAQELWNRYQETVPVALATRLGLRYINRFFIPPHRPFADYLTVPFQPPETVPVDTVTRAFSELEINDRDAGISARSILVVESLDGTAEVIIDTDAFRLARTALSAEVWGQFEELRQMKNRIFFGSITEHAAQEWE